LDSASRDNLAFAALNGLIYVVASWQGGRFGQRRGYFNALKLGFGVMTLALAGGWWFDFRHRPGASHRGVQRRDVFHLADHRGARGAKRGRRWPAAHGGHLQRGLGRPRTRWRCSAAARWWKNSDSKPYFFVPIAGFYRPADPCFRLQQHAHRRPRRRSRTRARARARPAPPSPAETRAFLRMAMGWRIRLPTSPSTPSFPCCPPWRRTSTSRPWFAGICVFVVGLRAGSARSSRCGPGRTGITVFAGS